MAQFAIESRLKNLPDAQRNFMFELIIPGIGAVTDGIMKKDEDLAVRVRSAVIPSRGNDPIESNFMGMKQFFPGRPSFGGNTFDVTIEETEDQIVHRAITAWQNQIFNIRLSDPTNGASLRPLKRQLTRDVYLLEYKYNQELMTNKVHYYNAFVQNVGDVSLDYSGGELVRYSVTFQYDFWDFENS